MMRWMMYFPGACAAAETPGIFSCEGGSVASAVSAVTCSACETTFHDNKAPAYPCTWSLEARLRK